MLWTPAFQAFVRLTEGIKKGNPMGTKKQANHSTSISRILTNAAGQGLGQGQPGGTRGDAWLLHGECGPLVVGSDLAIG